MHSYLVFILFYVLAAGKISRRVSLVHYPEPSELKERQERQMAKSRKKNQISSSMALTNSSQKTATPSRSTRTATTATPTHSMVQRNSRNGRAASPHSSEHKSSLSEAGEPSQVRNKRHASPGRSHSGVSSSGQGRSTTTTSSGERSSKKTKEKHRR